MKHRIAHRKLGRRTDARKALLVSLSQSLLKHDAIETTLPKAKEVRPFVEKIITIARQGTLASKKRLIASLPDKAVQRKLFDELGARFKKRPGGYTRIIKTGYRYGDCAPTARIELLDRPASSGA